MANLIYIMGTGRSGTTILEVLLKASEGIGGCGEVTHFPLDGFVKNVQCSCGRLSSECEQWRGVVQYIAGSGIESPEFVNKEIESHKNFPATFLGFNESARRDYDVLNNGIFNVLFKHAADKFLVDSSKYPGRAIALDKAGVYSLSVIGVTRCPYELLAAFQKQNEGEQLPKGYIETTLYYLYVIMCMRLASFKLKNFVSLRYENFVTFPVTELFKIEDRLGLDLTGSKVAVEQGAPMSPGHIVTGNRLRKEEEIVFRVRSEKHRSELPAGARLLAAFLSGYRNIMGF